MSKTRFAALALPFLLCLAAPLVSPIRAQSPTAADIAALRSEADRTAQAAAATRQHLADLSARLQRNPLNAPLAAEVARTGTLATAADTQAAVAAAALKVALGNYVAPRETAASAAAERMQAAVAAQMAANQNHPTPAYSAAQAVAEQAAAAARAQQEAVSRAQLAAVTMPTNLALGKPTAQSSTALGAISGRAVDGNTDGNWASNSVTHTESAAGAWWMVDLGAPYRIDNIVIYNRTDCCSERLDATVVVTATPGWPSASMQFRANLGATGSRYEVRTGATAVVGRYVYVVLNTPNFLSLAEVQVMGRPQ